jgi:hypothetical protein
MHFDIDFSPQISAQLTQAARSRGIDPSKLLELLVKEHLPPISAASESVSFPPTGRAAVRLQARLIHEKTDDPEVIRIAQDSLDEMKRSMNAGRVLSGAEEIF